MQITEEDIITAKKRLKKRKAGDSANWRNELIIEGGSEMDKSLMKMSNEILKQDETPKLWEQMKLISTHKKGLKELLTNKRGLFLTNILSKFFEKVVEDQIGPVKFDEHQFGGTKHRGTVDPWFILMSLIDEGKRLKKNVYLFFGDLVKCFDRLWLKDCLIDLHEAGAREREIRMLYNLNRVAEITIITPIGETSAIRVNEIVKQGTVFGTKLCCASTGKINSGVESKTVIYPNIYTQTLTFVDDITSPGPHHIVQSAGDRCSKLEEDKQWEFSVDKSKWMCMKFSRNEDVKPLNIVVKQGQVEETEKYKMLGNWANNKGNMDMQLEDMDKKVTSIAHNINIMCPQNKIGKMEFAAKRHVYLTLAQKSLFFNIEVWTNLRQKDKDKLECIQGKVLKSIFGLPKSTPYWGILYELDILPVHLHLTYKKLMLYHNIVNSDELRKTKTLVEKQKQMGHEECWFGNVKSEAAKIGICLGKQCVLNMKKSKWKKEVKEKISKAFNQEFECRRDSMEKLRFLHTKGVNTYLKNIFNEDARLAMMIRLNALQIISRNYGQHNQCDLCGNDEDNTEHVFLCGGLDHHDLDTSHLEKGTRMNEIVSLFKEMERRRREFLIDAIITNSNVYFREAEEG